MYFSTKLLYFIGNLQTLSIVFFAVSVKTGKLQNSYVVLIAVILNMAVSIRAANSLLLYALALLKLFATSLHRPKLVTLPKDIISI